MKTLKTPLKVAFALSFFVLLIAGCKPETESEVGLPFDKVEGISGTWELSQFIQKDLNNPIKEERDLSSFYIQDGVTPLRLSIDGNDRSYSVELSQGKNYFGEGGTWSFDDDTYPTYLFLETLVNDEEQSLQFALGRMVRSFDQELQIELERGCDLDTPDALPTVIYRFVFNRVNE